MKKVVVSVVVLCILILAGCQSTQSIPPSENTYSMIYEFPGMSAEEIFTAANDWMVTMFRSAESVIEYSDKESGIITGRCYADVPMGGFIPVNMRFKLTVNTKDGRARIKTDNMVRNSEGNVLYELATNFSRSDYNKFTTWADVALGDSFREYVEHGAADTW